MKKSIVFQVWDSDLGKDDPQGEVQCAQSSLFGWSEMHHVPYLMERPNLFCTHFGWSEMHQVVAKLTLMMQVQVPLWSRVGILDGFSETKDLLPITGDKSTKNKVSVTKTTKNPCHQTPRTHVTNHQELMSPITKNTKDPCHQSLRTHVTKHPINKWSSFYHRCIPEQGDDSYYKGFKDQDDDKIESIITIYSWSSSKSSW